MIKIRAKKLKSGLFSLYLDYNTTITHVDDQGNIRQKRKLEYLNLRVSHDYTAINKKTGKPIHKKIAPHDKETWSFALAVCRKRELMMVTSDRELIRDHRREENFVAFFTEQMKLSPTKDNSSYRGAFIHLNHFTNGHVAFKDIDIIWLQNFRKYLRHQVSDNSAQIYMDRLRIIFNVALKMKIIRESPFLDLEKIKKHQKDPVYLVLEELKILKAIQADYNPEITNAFFFACQTGLRYSDISTLSWEEVANQKYHCQKNKKYLTLYLSEQARDILKEQRAKNAGRFVFEINSIKSANYTLLKWGREAGLLKRITFHVSRHTCATLLISAGVDIYTVSKILGHSSVKMTERYAQVLEDKKLEAVQKLPRF